MNKPIVVCLALFSLWPGSALSQSPESSEPSFIQEKVQFFDATSGLGQEGFDTIHVHLGTVHRDKSLQWYLKDDPGNPTWATEAWETTLLPAFLKESFSCRSPGHPSQGGWLLDRRYIPWLVCSTVSRKPLHATHARSRRPWPTVGHP